jgi:hypothetical protein
MKTLQVAQTILDQLGGRRFTVMTGARKFVGGDDYLTFRLPGAGGYCKDSINCVRITLTPMDDYTMEFMRIRGTKVKEVRTAGGVYCNQLQTVFTDATGLATSL